MKKALLALGIGVVSFLVGLIGFMFVLPSVAPGRAEEARLYLDSLEAARLGHLLPDSVSQAGSAHTVDENVETADTLYGATGPAATPDHASGANASSTGMAPALKDTLSNLRRRIQTLHAENQTLRRQLDEARKAAQPQPASASDVTGLTETLAKLDDKELRPILEQIEGSVLEKLYKSTSGRTQARLLQAMPSDRAAKFVQNLVRGTSTSAATQNGSNPTPEKSTP